MSRITRLSLTGAAAIAVCLSTLAAPAHAAPAPVQAPATPSTPTAGSLYTVKRGDYLLGVAHKLQVSLDSLLSTNGLSKESVIHPGDQLVVPTGGVLPSTPPSTPSAAPPIPTAGSLYTVKRGDYFKRIAVALGVSMDNLLAVNNLKKTSVIHPGDQLVVPTGGVLPPPSGTIVLAAFPVAPTCAFRDTYGAPRSDERKHQGVDIIVPSGTPIYAVMNGTISQKNVEYVGSLGGNSLWLSADDGTHFYHAHLSAFATGIEIGSVVTAGAVIGYVGATGNASVPHLHFEVHPQGGAAVNPYPIVKAASICKRTSAFDAR